MSDDFIFYETVYGFNLAKELLYQKAQAKIDLFEKCLSEVGLYKSYPFLDISFKLPFLKQIIPNNLKNFPIDITEEQLMRNCVRRSKASLAEIKNLIVSK